MESLGLVSVAIERSAMVSVETESRLAGHAIPSGAFRYVGPQGLNLGVSEESERSLRFEDSAGLVSNHTEASGEESAHARQGLWAGVRRSDARIHQRPLDGPSLKAELHP